jgi:hypothetical protein
MAALAGGAEVDDRKPVVNAAWLVQQPLVSEMMAGGAVALLAEVYLT